MSVGFFDQEILKPACSATEASESNEVANIETRGVIQANLPYLTPDFNNILCLPTLSSGPDKIPYHSDVSLPVHNDICQTSDTVLRSQLTKIHEFYSVITAMANKPIIYDAASFKCSLSVACVYNPE